MGARRLGLGRTSKRALKVLPLNARLFGVGLLGRLRGLDDRVASRAQRAMLEGTMPVPKRLALASAVLLIVRFITAVVEPSVVRWGLNPSVAIT